jgi:hypothetical protein
MRKAEILAARIEETDKVYTAPAELSPDFIGVNDDSYLDKYDDF